MKGEKKDLHQKIIKHVKIHLSDTACHVILHVLKIAFTRTNNRTNCIDLYYVRAQVGRKNRFFAFIFVKFKKFGNIVKKYYNCERLM